MISGIDLLEDPCTGETLTASEKEKLAGGVVVSAYSRLGYVAQIGFLRDKLQKLLDLDTSIVLKKILYSGAHSGDSISVKEIPLLSVELDSIRRALEPDVQSFVNDVIRLTDAALEERNPIVFT